LDQVKKGYRTLIVVLIAGLALRVFRLGTHDFWHDEICSIGFAGVGRLIDNQPLYYLFLRFWIKFFGVSETVLRIPSVFFSIFSLVILYALGRRMFNERVALYATALMAVSPFQLWYAQEARAYSMFLCFALLSTLCLRQTLDKSSVRTWLGFGLFSLLGMLTSYFYVFIFAAHLTHIFFLRGWRSVLPFILTLLLFFAAYLPFLEKALFIFYYISAGFWSEVPRLKHIGMTLSNLIVGYNSTIFISTVITAVSCILLAIFALVGFKERKGHKDILRCFFYFSLPLVLAFLFSRLFVPVYMDRGLIAITPFYYLIIAFSITSLRRVFRYLAVIAVCASLVVGVVSYYCDWLSIPYWNGGIYIKRPVKPAVSFLKKNFSTGDSIAFTNNAAMLPFSFYAREPSSPYSFYRVSFKGASKTLSFMDQNFYSYIQGRETPLYYLFDPAVLNRSIGRGVEPYQCNIRIQDVASLKAKRIWVICSTWERDGRLDENSESVKKWMDKTYRLQMSRTIDGIVFLCYLTHG